MQRVGTRAPAGHPPGNGGLPAPSIIGVSAAWRAVVEMAQQAARSDARVLISGESGVGKDVVARLIHAGSARAAGPFVALNCAAIAQNLVESELFGHVRGSFTGAWRDHRGRAQVAHGGTLFLDEIGEMDLRMQAVLLRFVETGEVQPVGSPVPVSTVNVRLVAATNRHLSDMASAGRFREDLLYRLRVVHIHIPPLRERREDIPALVAHALARQPEPVTLSPAAEQALNKYHWPGNVRELQNAIEQAVHLARGGVVELAHLPDSLQPQPLVARVIHDRRRSTADRLYEALVAGRVQFWEHVHDWFLSREIARGDLTGVIARALAETRGNYHAVLALFRLPPEDYKRFLNFLSTHHCTLDVQPFRDGVADPRAVRALPLVDEACAGAGPVTHERRKNRSA